MWIIGITKNAKLRERRCVNRPSKHNPNQTRISGMDLANSGLGHIRIDPNNSNDPSIYLGRGWVSKKRIGSTRESILFPHFSLEDFEI